MDTMNIPTGWTKCTNTEVNQIYKEILEKINKHNLLKGHTLSDNLYTAKNCSSWGSCRTTKTTIKGKVHYDSVVMINEKIITRNNVQAAKEVLVHEMAHAIAPENHHGTTWKKLGNQLGEEWKIKVTRKNEQHGGMRLYGEEDKYAVECPTCKRTWGRNKLSTLIQYPQHYMCPECKEKLVRVR